MKLNFELRIKNYELRITLLILGFLLAGCWWLVVPSKAQSPAPSPNEERIQEKVEERIEKVLSDVEESKKQALVGILKKTGEATITIETRTEDVQANLADEMEILDEEKEEIELEDLKIGTKIIAMGLVGDQDIFEIKRIVVIEEFQIPLAEAIFGVVTDISSEEKVLTVKHPQDQTIYTVEMGTGVGITQNVEGEVETIEFEDIKENDRLVVVGETGENAEKMITAKLIHLVPTEGKALSAETEEEKPSPSPKPSPKPSPSPEAEEEE